MNMNTRMKHQVTSDGARRIPLTMGRFAIVDAEDYDWLSQHKWYAGGRRDRCYAQRNKRGKTIKMHREILQVPAGLVCDHRNHNGLDNRKHNLRICTPSQNSRNRRPQQGGTSRYKGVCWERGVGKWRAVICHRGRTIHIGYYDYEADAAVAYDDRAIELFGEFAYLDFQCRPEIEEWLHQTYFFPPMKNDLAGFAQTHHLPDPIVTEKRTPPLKKSAIFLSEKGGSRI